MLCRRIVSKRVSKCVGDLVNVCYLGIVLCSVFEDRASRSATNLPDHVPHLLTGSLAVKLGDIRLPRCSFIEANYLTRSRSLYPIGLMGVTGRMRIKTAEGFLARFDCLLAIIVEPWLGDPPR